MSVNIQRIHLFDSEAAEEIMREALRITDELNPDSDLRITTLQCVANLLSNITVKQDAGLPLSALGLGDLKRPH